jgi:catechol 2,3-dioxygenase-like lactoylglutathione lyase family enzyme
MPHSLSALALVVHDYDEAIAFFTEALRFTLLEDTPSSICTATSGISCSTVRPNRLWQADHHRNQVSSFLTAISRSLEKPGFITANDLSLWVC